MPPHPLTNFEIQKYYQNEPRFNGVYSRDNLQKIKDGAYIINLDEYSNIGTHWVAFYVQNNRATYFDSFRGEHIPKEIKTFIGNKNISNTSIWLKKIFVLDLLILCLQERLKLTLQIFFSPSNFKRNDDIILNYFYS